MVEPIRERGPSEPEPRLEVVVSRARLARNGDYIYSASVYIVDGMLFDLVFAGAWHEGGEALARAAALDWIARLRVSVTAVTREFADAEEVADG